MSNSITTTTTFTKIRGLSVKILKALKEGPKTAIELSLELEVKGNYLRPYLYNLRRYGLVEKSSLLWTIVKEREDIIENIININKEKERVKVSKRTSEKRVKEEQLREAFERFLKQRSYEVIVVDIARKLFEHYLEKGSTFVKFVTSEDMESFFGLYRKDIARAISILTNERVAYMWKSSGELKIALYKDFIEKLRSLGDSDGK
jgi:transcription initiation factor IIE alpha subunit